MKPILRKVDAGHNYSFSIREDIYPYLYNHWHYHPEIELTLIRKGTGMRLVGDGMEPFEDGDLILLGADLPHMWRSDPAYFKQLPELRIEAVAIHFKEEFWGSPFLQLPELKAIKQLLEQSRRGIKITGKARELITAKIEATVNADGVQRIANLLYILDLIASSGDHCFLSSPGFVNSYDLNNTDRISQIFTYTFNNFRQPITIREIAAAVNLSHNSFCRYFKTRTLKTYWQFLMEVRIGYACKLLIEDKLSIAQICYESGFNNLSNFNRQFKSILKTTPLKYIKNYITLNV